MLPKANTKEKLSRQRQITFARRVLLQWLHNLNHSMKHTLLQFCHGVGARLKIKLHYCTVEESKKFKPVCLCLQGTSIVFINLFCFPSLNLNDATTITKPVKGHSIAAECALKTCHSPLN